DKHGEFALLERSEVMAALRKLPGRQREVVVLRYYGDLSDEQVATTMGLSIGAVKRLASRAMVALRSVLERESSATLSPGPGNAIWKRCCAVSFELSLNPSSRVRTGWTGSGPGSADSAWRRPAGSWPKRPDPRCLAGCRCVTCCPSIGLRRPSCIPACTASAQATTGVPGIVG